MSSQDPITVFGERKFDPKFERKPSGTILINGQEIAHTLRCVHCSAHYVSIRGSGIHRGYCFNCHGVTCGNVKCDPCVPFEAKLDFVENRNSKLTQKLLQKFPLLIST
mgnify:CR=1 FL=1